MKRLTLFSLPSIEGASGLTRWGRTAVAAAAVLLPVWGGAHPLTVLHSFNFEDGQYPIAAPWVGADGQVFGTTSAGGAHSLGTVYRIAADGSFALLHSFAGEDGNSPDTGLVMRSDGWLLGSTPQGSEMRGPVASNFGGTLYAIDSAGNFNLLQRFDYNTPGWGNRPGAWATLDNQQHIGLLRSGGSNFTGQVVVADAAGALQVLHTFTPKEGSGLGAFLSPGSQGVWRGSLAQGPKSNANGALFAINAQGQYTVLHTFNGSDGRAPVPAMVEDANATVFGATGAGGLYDKGTLFSLSPSGKLKTLYHFNGDDGGGPTGVAWGPDGALYGLTFGGGEQNRGTIFRFDPVARVFTTLRMLQTADGTKPQAAAVFGADGLMYATTTQYGGAPGAGGSVFRFDVLAPQTPVLKMRKVCHNEFDLCMGFPADVGLGMSYTVYWNSANLSSCTASGDWSGKKSPSGHLDVKALRLGTFVYKLKCLATDGSPQSSQVTVRVGI